MLHKNVTPPLPNTDYVQTMLSDLKSNIRAVIDSKNEFITYFTYVLAKESKIAPKEVSDLYKQLDAFGTSFVKCLEEFIVLIEPTVKTTANLNLKRSEIAKALDEYQRKIVIVRKEMTEANISAEGEKLQAFAKSLSEFNKESNDYKHYLLKLYLSACFQLEEGLSSTLHLLNKAIQSPEEIAITQEEKELDDYMHKLNEQIAAKSEKERKAKEDAAAKAAKAKEEKEKVEKQKEEDKKAEIEEKEKKETTEEKKDKENEQDTNKEQEESEKDNDKDEENEQDTNKEQEDSEKGNKEDNDKDKEKSDTSDKETNNDDQKEAEN